MGLRVGLIFLAAVLPATELPRAGDADRGRERFRGLGCIACHSVDGEGGGYAPDLAKRIGREVTPVGMAAHVWNRGPLMWRMVRSRRLLLPELEEQDLADLYAYFYSARYFDRAPDPARGRQVFHWEHCAECHTPGGTGSGAAPAPADLPPPDSPIGLLERMWNAAGRMAEAMARKRVAWPDLTSQEAADLFGWLAEITRKRPLSGEMPVPSDDPGERVFERKGCKACHTGPNALSGRFSGRTLLDFAVAMWNHAPAMRRRPVLDYGELRQVSGYLWALQISQPPGSMARGKVCFTAKGCTACHEQALTGAPRLTGRRWDPFVLMAVLWRRGTIMQGKLESTGRSWPQLTAAEMADVIAYLNRPPTARSY